MTPDALFSFLLYQMQLGENISVCWVLFKIGNNIKFQAIGSVFTGLMESVGASRKVFEYMKREPKINYTGTEKPPKINGKIDFENVTFSYPSRATTTVLDVS